MRLTPWIASGAVSASLALAAWLGAGSADERTRAHAYFTDVELVDQHGTTQRFYSDLLKGKVVVVHSFFATCTGSCPVVIGSFAKIQEAMGDRLGRDVHLLSLTVDPVTDTPAKLKEYAERVRARPGWYFLTGARENVETALYKLGQSVKTKESHLNIVVIGNERTGSWKKAFSLAKPETLIRLVEELLNQG